MNLGANGLTSQALIFTLFGDYIRHRSDRIWIGSLVKLLGLFGISDQAVRSTVSRMVRRGWFRIERKGGLSYYVLTPKAHKLLAEGAARIFDFPTRTEHWDGCWQLVTYSIPEERREARDRLRLELSWLGFGQLTSAVWISPHNRRARLQEIAESLDIAPYVHVMSGELEGFSAFAAVVARCWDLASLNLEYARFIDKYEPEFVESRRRCQAGEAIQDAHCFVKRFLLIHEYRSFPYRDPQLPRELLPGDWQGEAAAELFQAYRQFLAGGANRYFESVFGAAPMGASGHRASTQDESPSREPIERGNHSLEQESR